jgi:hypothetical protein
MDITYIVLLELATTFPLIEDSDILKVANIFPEGKKEQTKRQDKARIQRIQ